MIKGERSHDRRLSFLTYIKIGKVATTDIFFITHDKFLQFIINLHVLQMNIS